MPEQNTIDPRWAWDRYQPSPANPWDLKKAGHLYRRASFGAPLAVLESAVRAGPERAIDALFRDQPDPAGSELWNMLGRSIRQSNNGQLLTSLWLYRLLYSPNPLREKLTLFWHNHFATSNTKVNNASYMLGQNELMRRHALGSFRTLLVEMSKDPAMLVWLDTIQSTRTQPNENYARELMELFSLGIRNGRRPDRPNYTEQDIREAARAFTGWRLVNGQPIFQSDQHDATEKNVLGQRGNWRGDDIVRICLEQESAPYFITAKLFRFLVSETIPPTPALLEPLATSFHESDYDTGALVQRILRSNLFFSPRAYRTKIKSPVEYVLGIIRGLEAHEDPTPRSERSEPRGSGGIGTLQLGIALEGLGQRLFYPPSVAGWDGGQSWLNGQTFLLRQNLALSLTSTVDDRFGRRLDPAPLARRHNAQTDEQLVDLFLRIFLQNDVAPASRSRMLNYLQTQNRTAHPVFWTPEDIANHRIRALCHLALAMPEFQLC